jgi:hypothetical protein
VVVLTPTSLSRHKLHDWFHREIRAALKSKRNIAPLLVNGFEFKTSPAGEHSEQSLLRQLSQWHSLEHARQSGRYGANLPGPALRVIHFEYVRTFR